MTRHWPPIITHISACESNSMLVLITVRHLWAFNCTVGTLAQDAGYLTTLLLLFSSFDKPRSQPDSLYLPPNALQVTTGFSAFLPHAGSLGVSPSSLASPYMGWEFILSWASRAAILASALVSSAAGLMPCCSCNFLTCICCSLDMEFQSALVYFLN